MNSEQENNISSDEQYKQELVNEFCTIIQIYIDYTTLFISAKEVEASWVWIDGIVKNWKKAESEPYLYQAGSMGPNQAHSMLVRDNREWD